MESLAGVPVPVGVSTNTAELSAPGSTFAMTNAELAECFQNARRANIHTQPPPADAKSIKKVLERVESFHSSQLNTFVYGYLHPGGNVPDHILNGIRSLCVNSDSDWCATCQRLAFDLLTAELQAKSTNVIPRANHDDPIALAQLRRVLPVMKYIPKVSVSHPHRKFVGHFSPDPAMNERIFATKISVQNNGSQSFTLDIPQTQTVIDGVKVEDKFIETTLERATIGRGEKVELHLRMKQAPGASFSELEQVIVLCVNDVLKYFVTFTVISPKQRVFRQRFPGCIPLPVQYSPLGPYSAPMVLQVLKHAFIRQGGLTNTAVVHLLLGKAVNFRPHNTVVMTEAVRLKETIADQMDLAALLDSYWASLPDAKKAPEGRRFTTPVSSAQPVEYSPGFDVPNPSQSVAAADVYFPTAQTRLPEALKMAPPAVIFAVILMWLAEMDIAVFDASFFNCDAVVYLQTMPPFLRGTLLWIVDLCCGLLMNRAVNGVNERVLALTFASVLVRRDAELRMEEETEAFSDAQNGGYGGEESAPLPGASFATEVAALQHAVTAMLFWISIYKVKYMKRTK